MKKYLLILPPYYQADSPAIALPSIAAQLKKKKYNVRILDYNLGFNYFIFSNKNKLNIIEKSFALYKNLNSYFEKSATDIKINFDIDTSFEQYKKLKDFYNKYDEKEVLLFINNKDDYSVFSENILKSIDNNDICKLIEIIYPYTHLNTNFFRPYKNYEEIKNLVNNVNIFDTFYKERIQKIEKNNPDYIGISINYHTQIIPGLKLAYKLKKVTNAHIDIGGNIITRIIDGIKKYPEFFDTFTDTISYGPGENYILEIAQYIEQKIPLKKVHNILYKNAVHKVIVNKMGKQPLLSKIAIPDYSDLLLDKYLYQKEGIILPLQTHRGCYWNKCTFCDGTYLQNFSTKKISDLISEIKSNIKDYNVSHYSIVDPAVHPKYLNLFCDALRKNNIKISFEFQARFEPEFNFELLEKAKLSGATRIWWGMETTNPRILKLLNKGINIKNMEKILADSAKIGIENIVFAFIGFPTETEKEALETVNFLLSNENITQPILHSFMLYKYSHVYNHPDKYNIEIYPEQDEFTILAKYKSKTGMDRNKINEIFEYFYTELEKKYKSK